MKHTQGEWKLSEDEKGVSVNGKLIITCWTARPTDETRMIGESWLDMRERTKEERELNNYHEPKANARLIAAAPNLLKALSDIISSIDDDLGAFKGVDKNSQYVLIAKAAIDKATKD